MVSARHPSTVLVVSDFGFDPVRALEQIRRLAAGAPAQLADGVGRLVRDTPPARLEQIMRSPARRPLLDGIFWQMPRQLDAARAAGVSTAIRWRITGRADDGVDTYHLLVDDGRARTTREPHPDPRLTITMDGVELLRIVSGNSDPMKAYFKGRVQLSGDIMAAAQVAQLFRMPGARRPGGNGGGRPA